MIVAPLVRVPRIAFPLVIDTNTAGESRHTINDEELTMGAIVDSIKRVPLEGTTAVDLYALALPSCRSGSGRTESTRPDPAGHALQGLRLLSKRNAVADCLVMSSDQ